MNGLILHGIHNGSYEEKNKPDEIVGYHEELPEHIRVLLHTTDFKSIYHPHIKLRMEGSYVLENENRSEKRADCFLEDTDINMSQNDVLKLRPLEEHCRIYIESIQRNVKNKIPAYRGSLELKKTESGYIVINELPVEEYLYGVVGSEMPSGYPTEALKAQAVCARTYAYKAIQEKRIKEYDADVDDSTSFQVYQNVEETKTVINVVNATKGEVLTEGGMLIEACYYSTSCGMGKQGRISSNSTQKQVNLSKEKKFRIFIDEKTEEDYEKEEPWYRWKGNLSLEEIEIPHMGKIKKIAVLARQKNGMIDKLLIQGEKETMILRGEYEIRSTLGNTKMCIVKQDGSTATNMNLLPSAFFYIVPLGGGDYTISGGGYGHGMGMSQNAAKYMAAENKTYKEILAYFYENAGIYKRK